jgi:hypothetical protein
LCTVWPQGPAAQAFVKNPTPEGAREAAIEVRREIEQSFYVDYELGQDHIELLRRIEAADEFDLARLADLESGQDG